MWNTTRMTLSAGAAALAMAAAPVAFAQGKNYGNGNGNGGQPAAQSKGNSGKSGGKPDRGAPKAERGNGGGNNDRGGPPERADRGNGSGKDRGGPQAKTDRGNGNGNSGVKAVRGNGNPGKGGNDRANGRDGIDIDVRFALPLLRETYGTRTQLIDGCPPGLAKKRNGCLPPGQAKKLYGSYNPGFFGLFADRGDYYYRDGYLLRYRADGLAGYIPLLAGALGIGNVWPSYYEPRPIPRYYDDYYGFDDRYGYRYADNVIYRVEPESAAILGVTALLTGDDIVIGRPMPRGYDVYNVPYRYRDRYYDRPGKRYRYADGYVYEIDTETALVVSAIELLS